MERKCYDCYKGSAEYCESSNKIKDKHFCEDCFRIRFPKKVEPPRFRWIKFTEFKPNFNSSVLLFDGVGRIDLDDVYVEEDRDYYHDWSPRPVYWMYSEDIAEMALESIAAAEVEKD